MITNASLSAPTSSRADTAQPAIATQPRTATVGLHLVMLALTLLVVAGCNTKTTNNGGTKADTTAQSNKRTGDDDERMGPPSGVRKMMNDDKDTTHNRPHERGMMNR